MWRALAAALALVLTVAPATVQSSESQFNGRALILTDGRADAGTPAPLLIVLHGLTGTAGIMQRKTGFDALAQRHGFVVAYPNGIGRRWRDASGSRDVAYLTALIDSLTANLGTDPAHVYLAGYSNGGSMALRLACSTPARLRAIAVVAMTQPRGSDCAGTAPLPALFIHGALDPIVPVEGLPGRRTFPGLHSIQDTLRLWSRRNRCAGTAPAQVFDQIPGPDAAQITRYTGCAAPLSSVNLTGQGHDWPGAAPRLTFLLGPASREVDAGPFIWQFFSLLN
jgi:polyhydroxybutyrate depolymerase